MKKMTVNAFFQLPPGTLFYIPDESNSEAGTQYSELMVKGETFPRRHSNSDEAAGRCVLRDHRCTYRPFGLGKVITNSILDCSSYLGVDYAHDQRAQDPNAVQRHAYTLFWVLEPEDVAELMAVLSGCPAAKSEPVKPAAPITTAPVHRTTRLDRPEDQLHNTVEETPVRVTHMRAIHPGEVLLEEYMKPLHIGEAELAHRLGVPVNDIQLLTEHRTAITPQMAVRLERFFRTTAEFWINLQTAYDLKRAYQFYDTEIGQASIKGIVAWPRGRAGELLPRV